MGWRWSSAFLLVLTSPADASSLEALEERLLSSALRRIERLEWHMSSWMHTCMRFIPREWVEAQGFVWADAVLAAVMLGLVALSYVMLAHMFRSWGVEPQNSSSITAPRQTHSTPVRGVADGSSSGSLSDGAGQMTTGARSGSCAHYGPIHDEIDGMTALMRASSQGDESCAGELIEAGASVDARDSQEGFTALLMASAMGRLADRVHPYHHHPLALALAPSPSLLPSPLLLLLSSPLPLSCPSTISSPNLPPLSRACARPRSHPQALP